MEREEALNLKNGERVVRTLHGPRGDYEVTGIVRDSRPYGEEGLIEFRWTDSGRFIGDSFLSVDEMDNVRAV